MTPPTIFTKIDTLTSTIFRHWQELLQIMNTNTDETTRIDTPRFDINGINKVIYISCSVNDADLIVKIDLDHPRFVDTVLPQGVDVVNYIDALSKLQELRMDIHTLYQACRYNHMGVETVMGLIQALSSEITRFTKEEPNKQKTEIKGD